MTMTSGTRRSEAGRVRVGAAVPAARRWSAWRSAWDGAGGALALVAAAALWVAVLAGVAAPLGEALARLDAPPAPSEAPPCAVPAGALAAAPVAGRATPAARCR